MPPPPPPSKSYLLVIDDTDSSDEEPVIPVAATVVDEEEPPRHDNESPTEEESTIDIDSTSLNDSAHTMEDHDEPEKEHEDDHKNSPSSKRKRKKRKKRKKKKTLKKQVSFGHVHVREHERQLGTDVVPGDGGWPLGLSDEVNSEAAESVEDFEVQRQTRLTERWKQVHNEEETPPPPDQLETRQYDYKYKVKNPLFRVVTEKERMQLLLGSPNQVTPDKQNSNSSSSNGGMSTRRRSRSVAEEYNETFTQVDVHHVRNELEKLRNARSMDGAAGCTCRKLHVYLPPPDGGGKKAQHRRMNPRKVTEELRKRHLLPQEPKTREQLEQLLHDVVEQEPCCGDDCSCVQNGIECQADTCFCWHASHQTHVAKKNDAYPSCKVIQERCGNRFGMYTVNVDRIDMHRKEKILVCQPVTTLATSPASA